MNYSLFKWSRKTCSGHDSNAAILQASREYVTQAGKIINEKNPFIASRAFEANPIQPIGLF